MITISHFLRNKSRKIGRKLCASDHRLMAALINKYHILNTSNE